VNVYVFGNPDVEGDSPAIRAAEKLKKSLKSTDFIFIKPNQDLPFTGEKPVVILDTVQGIDQVTVLDEKDLDKLIISKSITAHDYDLGFQLKYLIKLKKLTGLKIVGIPQTGVIDYRRIQSILRKLVAQDMQGS
jgi:Ni,Fe-hydrogenase maturation factor